MSKAFRCDCCDEFREGTPKRIKVRRYGGTSFMSGWTDGDDLFKMELCVSCADTLASTISDVLEGDDE